MADEKVYTILLDIQKQLGENTRKTESVSSDLKVYITGQTALNSKINGLITSHHEQLIAMPETLRREIFGEVNKVKETVGGEINKLKETVEEVKKSHTEESSDKRKTWLEVAKFGATSVITLLVGFVAYILKPDK